MASKLKMTNSDGNIIEVSVPAGSAGSITIGSVATSVQADIDSRALQTDLDNLSNSVDVNRTDISNLQTAINNLQAALANKADINGNAANDFTVKDLIVSGNTITIN